MTAPLEFLTILLESISIFTGFPLCSLNSYQVTCTEVPVLIIIIVLIKFHILHVDR